MAEFSLTPRKVPVVHTKYRDIVTEIPVPESLPILEKLRKYEPRSMGGQPPVVWDRAEGFQVFDAWGNRWLDWSSGVLVTNAGHNHPKIRDAIINQATHGLIHNYCFPSKERALLTEALASVAPAPKLASASSNWRDPGAKRSAARRKSRSSAFPMRFTVGRSAPR
jgi:4-aminobutyrate aminotransferase/diaminobutyrate-pyruvate transaminase/4-aminobutyrate aminotransferase/(S)-3-amino-2-methylpropionate transaminase